MKYCCDLDKFITGNLRGRGKDEFERHLVECAQCRKEVERWESLKGRVEDWSESIVLPNPTVAETAELVMGLRPKGAGGEWFRPALAMGATALGLLALVLFFVFGTGGDAPGAPTDAEDRSAVFSHPIRVVYSESSELPSTQDSYGKRLVVDGTGRLIFELGKDRIGLSEKSEIAILRADEDETRIRIHRGEMAVSVSPRQGDRAFTVDAADCAIRVVGTQFQVSFETESALAVYVDHGEVSVTGPGDTAHTVKAGQILTLDDMQRWVYHTLEGERREAIASMLVPPSQKEEMDLPAEEPSDGEDLASKASHPKHPGSKSPAELDTIREWILDGEYGRAESALLTQLNKKPNNVELLSLLANCRRKAGNWQGAVSTYERIIENGDGRGVGSARFNAACLLQDKLGRHEAAARLLSEYLDTSPLLEAEAMVRLAKAWVATGKTEKARQMLMDVKAHHGSTSAAIRAAKLLEKIGETE